MASNTQKRSAPWWMMILAIVAVIVLIWTFFAAINARDLATANETRIRVERLDANYVAGAPERFTERFDEAMNEVEQDIQPDDLLWTTLIVANRGLGEAEDVTGTVTLAPGLDPILTADLAGFSDLEVTTEEQTLELDIGDLDVDDTALVFMGFQPNNVADAIEDAWAGFHDQTVDFIQVSSDDSVDVLYGDFLPVQTQ